MDVESGGFHLHSTSSVGKTLSLRVAGSVFGPAGRADLGNWKSSDAGLEDLAVAHNDRLLCLDEVGRSSSDAKEVGKRARELTFLIAGERGRELSASYTGGSPASWRLQLLSTGERGIAELARLGGTGRLKGEEARLIDVPVEDHPELGIFRGLPEGCESSAALVAALEEACGQRFGRAGRAFVERFGADPGPLAEVRRRAHGHLPSQGGRARLGLGAPVRQAVRAGLRGRPAGDRVRDPAVDVAAGVRRDRAVLPGRAGRDPGHGGADRRGARPAARGAGRQGQAGRPAADRPQAAERRELRAAVGFLKTTPRPATTWR